MLGKKSKYSFFMASVLILSAFLLSGCVEKGLRLGGGESEDQNETQTAPGTDTGGKEGAFVGKLKDAVLSGKTMKCSWKKDDSSGETYVRGEDVYGEFTAAGKTGYMIMREGCMYSWNDEINQGIKMCSVEEEADAMDDEVDVGVDFEQMKGSGLPDDINYECESVLFGDERFELPGDKEFVDLNNLVSGE